MRMAIWLWLALIISGINQETLSLSESTLGTNLSDYMGLPKADELGLLWSWNLKKDPI